jgi:hypothetical protein
MRISRAVLVVFFVAAVSCDRTPSASHVSLSSIDAVKAAFNADSGKVRAIFLASPT